MNSEKFSLVLRIISIYVSLISLVFAIRKYRREKAEREFRAFRAQLDRAPRKDVGIFPKGSRIK
jgi:hypothetical protein